MRIVRQNEEFGLEKAVSVEWKSPGFCAKTIPLKVTALYHALRAPLRTNGWSIRDQSGRNMTTRLSAELAFQGLSEIAHIEH